MIGPADEERHRLHARQEERWWFDFTSPGLAGYARLAYRPWERAAWWWAAVVGPDQPLVAVRAHDIDIPARGTEIRGDGVWAALTCETPLDHWSVGLESFGAEFDDPWEAWRDERGDVIPFGLDVEWEAAGPAGRQPDGYAQWCTVHGDVLLGDRTLPVDGTGSREHAWGPPEGPGWRCAIDGRVRRGDLPHEPDHVTAISPVLVPGLRVVHSVIDHRGWLTTRE